ncbi:hypothetical protein V8E36_008382 [Tilletia maclaganii]
MVACVVGLFAWRSGVHLPHQATVPHANATPDVLTWVTFGNIPVDETLGLLLYATLGASHHTDGGFSSQLNPLPPRISNHRPARHRTIHPRLRGTLEATPTAHPTSTDTTSPPQLTIRLAQDKLTALLVNIDVNKPIHSAGGNTDLWLVLTLRDQGSASDVPFAILASQRVIAHRPTHSYQFINPPHQGISTSGNTDVLLKSTSLSSTVVASETSPFDLDPAAEAYFEDILAQYCAFEAPDDAAPPSPLSDSAANTPGSDSRDTSSEGGAGHGEIELFDPSPVLFDLSNARNTGAFASGSSSSSGAPNPAGAIRVSPLCEGDIEATKLGAGDKEEVDPS